MLKKALSLNLEFLVRIVVFALVVFGLAYMIFGKDFQMKIEATNTQKRLVNAFIEVAKNYEKYNYSYRYGGKSNGNAVICEVPYTEKKPCGVSIVLPQELNMISKEALPALGDPKYIIYWDRYENVESEAWSGWFWFDAALTVIPPGKVVGAVKGALKAGKLIFKFGINPASSAAQALGKGIRMIGKSIKYLKKGEEEIAEEGVEYVVKTTTQAGEEGLAPGLKNVAEVITKEDEKAGEAMEKVQKVLKEEADKSMKYFGSTKASVIVITKSNFLKGIKVLEKTVGKKEASKIKSLIQSNKAWICSFSGAATGITLPVIINTLQKEGYIEGEDAEYYYYKGGIQIPKDIAQTAAWSLLLRKVVENGRTKIKTLAFKKDPSSPTGYIIKELDLIDLTGAKSVEDWTVYKVTYDAATGDLKSEPLGKVKEILENEDLKRKSAESCFYSAALTFAPIFGIHTLEAKYEMVKGEAEKCKNAVCIKGPAMAPKTYKKEELVKALKNSHICGIKIMNANESLEEVILSIKLRETTEFSKHNFYLASPCFAYAQFWVGDCEDPTKTCDDDDVCSKWYDESGECKNEEKCCRRCIWVSLQEGKFLPFQENSAFNFCTLAPKARVIEYVFQMPWPWTGYWWFE